MNHHDIVWLTDDALAAELHLEGAYLTIHRAQHFLLLGYPVATRHTATWQLRLTGRRAEHLTPIDLGPSGPVSAQQRASLLLADHVPTVHTALTLQRTRQLGSDTAWALVREYADQHRESGYNPSLDAFTCRAADDLVARADEALTPTAAAA